MDLTGFNANEVDPLAPREPIPAGWYKAVIVESEERTTKAMTGSFLLLTLEIIEGDMEGRKVFDRLNLNNHNETAVQLAKATLSSICRAIGVASPGSSSALHDKPLMVKVKVKPPKDGYDASNAISEYAAVNKPTAAPADGNAMATPPWKRK